MFKIGLFDNFFQAAEENSSFEGYEFTYLENNQLMPELSLLDGVILCYEQENEKVITYERIVTIKSISQLPIWVVSTNMTDEEKLVLLKLGAFAGRALCKQELSLNIANTLTLVESQQQGEPSDITKQMLPNPSNHEEIQFNVGNLSGRFGDSQEIYLTRLEYQLLEILNRKKNLAVTYNEIETYLWGESKKDGQMYRIANLAFLVRQKLKKNAVNPGFIKTIRSVGYMLDTRHLK